MALRTQIVQYVTSGVRNAVRRTNLTPPRKSAFVDIFNGGLSRKKDPAVTPGLEVLEFLLEGKVQDPFLSCFLPVYCISLFSFLYFFLFFISFSNSHSLSPFLSLSLSLPLSLSPCQASTPSRLLLQVYFTS